MIKNPKILIVDDEPRMCKSLKTLLGTQSYEVQTCCSGKEALKSLGKNKFDLILQDVFMEGMDGFQVFDKIKNQKINTPVIIMSGNASTDSAVTALRMGASDYLKKPFGSQELFSSVKNAIYLRTLKRENKAVRKKLNASEEKFRNLVESSSDWLWEVNTEGVYTYSSPQCEKILGYKPVEIVGKTPFDLMPPKEAVKIAEFFKNIIAKGESIVAVENVNFHKNGQRVILETSGVPARNELGEIICYRGVDRDITKRKQAEKALLKSEEQNRILFQSISDAIFLVNVETLAILNTNEAAVELYGYKREELLGLRVTDLFVESDGTKKDIQNFKSRSIPIRYSKRQDGSLFPVEITANYFTLNGKKVNISTVRDISRRIEFEKKKDAFASQINQIWKMESIGTLAGGIAHDFNNLLYVVMGNISLAQYDLKPEIGTSKNLKAAKDACIKAKELSTRLITFSKGGEPVKKISPIIDLLKDAVIAVWKESNIKPEFLITDTLRKVYIDKTQIKQAVHNIVVNAKEAMDDNGQFKVSCENIAIPEKGYQTLNQGKYIKISFKDQGCGIPKQNLRKIFDPYFSTKERGTDKGQGLGLAISYSIIKKHKGLITVKSEHGTGSTFSIYLQASTVKGSNLKEPGGKLKAKTPFQRHVTGKGKILLMDDEKAVRDFMGQALSRLGYDVETCIEGKETVEIYKKAMESDKAFDMVILDLTNKFGMGGQETMKRLLEINNDVKGIVTTGYSQDPVITNFRAYGFSGFLEKPATGDVLSSVISKVISRSK